MMLFEPILPMVTFPSSQPMFCYKIEKEEFHVDNGNGFGIKMPSKNKVFYLACFSW